jgi:hypothetical protein
MARFEPLHEQGRLTLLEGEESVIDDEQCPHLSAFLCPGHTPGHIAVRIHDETANQKAFYIGDAMHFACQVEKPDLVPLFDCCAWRSRPFLPMVNIEETWLPAMRSNPKWNIQTSSNARRELLQKVLDQRGLIISPHFSPPGMGTIQQSNDGREFQYLPKKLVGCSIAD